MILIYKKFDQTTPYKDSFPSGSLTVLILPPMLSNLSQFKMSMIRMSVEDPRTRGFLYAFQNPTKHDVSLYGSDGIFVNTGSLRLYSSLVRSILGSPDNPRDFAFVIPDYDSKELREALKILDRQEDGDILISKSTRNVLRILGVNLENFIKPTSSPEEKVSARVQNPIETHSIKIEEICLDMDDSDEVCNSESEAHEDLENINNTDPTDGTTNEDYDEPEQVNSVNEEDISLNNAYDSAENVNPIEN